MSRASALGSLRSAVGLVALGAATVALAAARVPGQVPPMALHDEDPVPVGGDPLPPLSATPCAEGHAGPFPCAGIDLVAFVPLAALGPAATRANDIWGWTDPETGREYALVGLEGGTAFVDLGNPEQPLLLGTLPSHTVASVWRDVKVFADHALIVSEAAGHGLQVFDLRQLRDVLVPPVSFGETAHYAGGGLTSAHNLVVNEETGFAWAVGSKTCGGGLHAIDVRDPRRPAFAGCFADDGYTHDAQCVVYRGPDPDYAGRELCFAANEETLTVVDVTDKGAARLVSRTSYDGVAYVHQAWLTEDQHYLLVDDELDERRDGHETRTYVLDVTDLDAPRLAFVHSGPTAAIDHNQYVHRGLAFQADYAAGLRLLDLSRIARGSLRETGFFDVHPQDDATDFVGAWSVYPFLPSGLVVVTGIGEGLFVLDPRR
jgi:choice-of-anchor B domain-containing protein